MIRGKYLSSDNKNFIEYFIFEPKTKIKPKGIIQISHGMQDYILRYKHLIQFLNSQGYVVCGNDDLGHGHTTLQEEDKGFFGYENGRKYVLADLYTMTKIAKEKYGNLPYVLVGHSMGSFFARLYAYAFPNELSGLVLLGTSGKVAGTSFAIMLLNFIKMIKGGKSPCLLANKIMTKKYFKYIDNVKTGSEWVTSNEKELKAFETDEIRGKQFKTSGYIEMLKVLKFVNTKKWARGISKDLPIAIYSGSHDPVGNYGYGTAGVYKLLENEKVKNIEFKLYPKARHELHNEQEHIKKEFFEDLGNWLEVTQS